MYIRVSGINSMVSRHDLSRIFTFRSPICKEICESASEQLYFYDLLSDMYVAELLNGQCILDDLKIEIVKLHLEDDEYSKIMSEGSSCCLCIISSDILVIENIERCFGQTVRCYIQEKGSKKMLSVIEFNQSVEVKRHAAMDFVFSFEAYICHVVCNMLYESRSHEYCRK
ncbi:hypothetical protein CWI42_030550 [Ordospora colligata]|uniref:Uncharacterized protein n=1 Tax=Ordospora colligata OC4 TaxID=1354746 RepID=A0A0B2UG25_9MICR|nr:uncharacterized protein M896_030260 [Ordospora colligata OC4]KHN70041.1 hypothetical protein M896_030260 [Ordospora colligata OC4]TBU16423.1 hypothetical protein CWI41_030220 [Ordospora colligata]TBU16608.1 hypothetical protein CWI40_030620 [Ordospora colligata]TBU19181.1 hypothetical protein CWI42_030550 [Ordospora colligata]